MIDVVGVYCLFVGVGVFDVVCVGCEDFYVEVWMVVGYGDVLVDDGYGNVFEKMIVFGFVGVIKCGLYGFFS